MPWLVKSAMGKETFYERWLLTKISDNGTFLLYTWTQTSGACGEGGVKGSEGVGAGVLFNI